MNGHTGTPLSVQGGYWAHIRAKERREARRQAADLRPGHVKAQEIVDNHRPLQREGASPRPPENRSHAEIIAALKAVVIDDDAKADAARQEADRRRALKVRRHRKVQATAAARAEVKAKARRRMAAAGPPKPTPAATGHGKAPLGFRFLSLFGRGR